jgi:hypothetical protein
MPGGETEQADLAAALERQALLEREVAAYRVTETSGPRERLVRVESLRGGLAQMYRPWVWLAVAMAVFMFEVTLGAPFHLNIPLAFYAAVALCGCAHQMVVLLHLHRKLNGRAP